MDISAWTLVIEKLQLFIQQISFAAGLEGGEVGGPEGFDAGEGFAFADGFEAGFVDEEFVELIEAELVGVELM